MRKKIIGVTVGTPTSPAKMEKVINPVKTVNGIAPDEAGNVTLTEIADTITLLNDCGIIAPVADGSGAIYTADENTIYVL